MRDEVTQQATALALSGGKYMLFVQVADAIHNDCTDLGGTVGGIVYTFRVRVRTAKRVSREIEVTLLYTYRYQQLIVRSIGL